jgi:phenylacetate-CoA ligase
MVGHAYRTVPYYRKVMDDRGLTPAEFRTAADLVRLPIIGGRDLAENPERFLSRAISPPNILELDTTGSSGAYRRIRHDAAGLFQARAVGLREREVLTRFVGRGAGYREIGVAREGGTRPVIWDFYRARAWIPRQFDLHRTALSPADPFERNLDVINTFEPDVVAGFGAYIGALFRWAWQNQRDVFRPKVISYGGDMLRPPDRELIEGDFQIPVLSTYQACEALHIAFQCERGRGFHIHSDQVVVRVVDREGQDLPPGRSGRIVISNLTNRATVLLNYELGDLATLSETPCPCGRSLPVIQSLEGRIDDLVQRPDGEVAHEAVILPRLYGVPGVLQIQLEQKSLQDFCLRVVTREDVRWIRTQEGLDTALRSVLGNGDGLSLEIDRVEEIACGPGGKYKAILSACRPAAPV